MRKNWSEMRIGIPTFRDADVFLKVCGLTIVKEIVKSIDNELRPDGTPQKQNAPSTRLEKQILKGYQTPLKGAHPESPYIARHTYVAWLRDFLPPNKLLIHLNAKRAAIGKKVTKMGYWFVGITKGAERQIAQTTWQYLQKKLKDMASGKAV
ncbi:MAG: hypothetical protein PHD37_17240 [Gallionellaceae bacterium]|nr:hypothetical protein [Gallionellaceae bacterium]